MGTGSNSITAVRSGCYTASIPPHQYDSNPLYSGNRHMCRSHRLQGRAGHSLSWEMACQPCHEGIKIHWLSQGQRVLGRMLMGDSLMQVLFVVWAISLLASADVRAVIKSLEKTVLCI